MNLSWIWPCDLEVKGSKSNYWTPEIPSHFCLTITAALMKGVVSYCTQPGSPAPWGRVARICPFQTAHFIFSPFPDRGFIFFRKEVLSTWEGSCEHRIYNPILGTFLMLDIWKYWVIPKRESVTTAHRLFMASLWLTFDFQDSALAAGSCHLLPVIFLPVLLCCHHSEWHTGEGGWQNLNAQGKNRSNCSSDSSLVPLVLVHVALWWQSPTLWARKASVGKFCDSTGQGDVLLELDF